MNDRIDQKSVPRKSIAEVTGEELQNLACTAFAEAARAAAAEGHQVAGFVAGERVVGLEEDRYLTSTREPKSHATGTGGRRKPGARSTKRSKGSTTPDLSV